MINFWILVIISFTGTFYVLPHSIRKLGEAGYVARDMYKQDKPSIPTNAGIIVLFTSFISISLLPLIVRFINLISPSETSISDLSEINLALLLVVSVYGLYGLVDDLVDISRKLKIILPITFGFPLISLINPNYIWIPILGNFDLMTPFYSGVLWNDIFRISVVPVYIMVVSNLVNMHSGYNGLQSGLSIIILSALLIKSFLDGILISILPAGAFLGAMIAFWYFNKYPAKVFEGNIGSLLFGSLIGSIIVIQQYWWFGFFILIPHTINFLLWVYWLFKMHTNPEKYLDANGSHSKFGYTNSNGILVVPNVLTLKWIPSHFWEIGEKQSTIMMYSISLLFCIIGVILI